eukprot:1017894-Prorocentrum_minimum.AAC.4
MRLAIRSRDLFPPALCVLNMRTAPIEVSQLRCFARALRALLNPRDYLLRGLQRPCASNH